MYGMIHRGIRFMVSEELGESVWEEICETLQIGPEHLISASTYDDALTIRILQKVAQGVGVALPDLLRKFGRHWIKFADRGSYAAMMDFTGRDLVTFVSNLDRMHQAVVVAMPNARVPSFRLVENQAGRLVIAYRSERAGLESFVVGLLEGLLVRFELRGSVACLAEGNDPALFEVVLSPNV